MYTTNKKIIKHPLKYPKQYISFHDKLFVIDILICYLNALNRLVSQDKLNENVFTTP